MKFIGHFGFRSGRKLDKFKGIGYKIGVSGAPVVLENTVSYLECELKGSLEVGTHTLFIGKMIEAEILQVGEPMTYAYYHLIKGGRAPKAAPTYEETEEEAG